MKDLDEIPLLRKQRRTNSPRQLQGLTKLFGTRTIKLNIEQSLWMESLNGSRNNFIPIEFDPGICIKRPSGFFELDTFDISRRSRFLYDLALAA